MLLSHVDPQLTLGKLVGRLVQDGLDRYDPTRTRRRRGTTARASGTGEQAAGTQDAPTTARRDTSAPKRDGQLESAAPAAAARGRDDQAALQREQRDRRLGVRHHGAAVADAHRVGSNAAVADVHEVGGGAALAEKRYGRTAHRGRPASGEQGLPGSTDSGVQRDAQPALSRAPAGQQRALGDRATSAAKQLDRSGCYAPSSVPAPHTGGNSGAAAGGPSIPSGNRARRTTSPHKPAVPPQGTAAAELHTASDRDCSDTGPRSSASHESSAARPGAPSRYIPAAVRREVWRRDEGCCSYVDQASARRCGSRYRLQIDHIVPFALGGDAQPSNLRLCCEAHHRYRHAPRRARRAGGAQGERRWSRSARGAPNSGPADRGQSAERHVAPSSRCVISAIVSAFSYRFRRGVAFAPLDILTEAAPRRPLAVGRRDRRADMPGRYLGSTQVQVSPAKPTWRSWTSVPTDCLWAA